MRRWTLKCEKCGLRYDVKHGTFLGCPNACDSVFRGVVDATGAVTLQQISNLFHEFEDADLMVGEVILDPAVLLRLDEEDVTDHEGDLAVTGDHGIVNRCLWGTCVRIGTKHVDCMVVWGENKVLNQQYHIL